LIFFFFIYFYASSTFAYSLSSLLLYAVAHSQVQAGPKGLVYPYEFPPVAKSFIESLLQLDPEARLGVNDFAEIKSHPFFECMD
jgi:hypothetical protein